MSFKRDPIKFVRDKAKAKYEKGTECYICGSTDTLDFHHFYSLTPLFNKWLKDNKMTINSDEDVLAVREQFIAEHHDELYIHAKTLCHTHHMQLHSVYGKHPPLVTAQKQMRWTEKQRESMGFQDWVYNKLNPAQPRISGGGTREESSSEPSLAYQTCCEKLEVVNRAVNMIVDDVAQIKYVVGDQIPSLTPFAKGVRKVQLNKLLNKEPNPFQDQNSFVRSLVLDFVIDGNMFMYWDGAALYQMPATRMKVVSDEKNYISHYEFDGDKKTKYYPNEIIHIKDNNYQTIYRGASRLKPALRTMNSLLDMRSFQDNFFKNGAVPGLALTTDERLNERHKDKLLQEWSARYNPRNGGRRPVILDGGLKVDPISNVNFKELDFQNSIIENEKVVLKALGIPPLLLDGGNNANIRPNHRIYYLETILPVVAKICSGLERFFGFEVYEDTTYIHALRPELRDEAAYYQSLVNGGVLTPNEARDKLGLPPITGHDDLRIPANIAGSAADPSQGGRPPEENDDTKSYDS